ncbi:MAG TPA: arsenate reductase ArsC [Magnetospirillaceae bacterium]|nr:arsenate reductase ArsC [Magnetospirillaceae bacterium]
MGDKVYNVLFLCPHDAARGLMAEAILNRVGQGRFNAYSAGSFPSSELHDETVRMLEKLNYDVSHLYSKAWDEFAVPDAPEMDFVFTMCDADAGEPCPVWPGQPMTAYWSVPSPTAIEEDGAEGGLALAEIYRELNNRIRLLVNLRVDALDRMALQHELDTIGSPYIT